MIVTIMIYAFCFMVASVFLVDQVIISIAHSIAAVICIIYAGYCHLKKYEIAAKYTYLLEKSDKK